jgi:hypothetical protein
MIRSKAAKGYFIELNIVKGKPLIVNNVAYKWLITVYVYDNGSDDSPLS